MSNLKTFPWGYLLNLSERECKIISKYLEDFEKELPPVFDKIYDKIEWILTHKEVANKTWFLEQIESLHSFIQLREKEILGETNE